MAPREWINPRTGDTKTLDLVDNTPEEVRSAAQASRVAWESYRSASHETRAEVLNVMAEALDAHLDDVVTIADEESALGTPRLVGEVARTSFQLRMFAHALGDNSLFRGEVDSPVDGAPPVGRPELVRTYVPLGPVAVFGASNFPFAFGVLGGDTASALAAGCTVVAKEHSAHPRLSRLLLDITRSALGEAGLNEDLLIGIRGTAAGATLVAEPDIAAVGFTGSLAGGRFLFDIAVSRPHPIPFYGELGSINPVIVTRAAAQERPGDIGKGFAESLLLGAGQFCTKPSMLIYPEGSGVIDAALATLANSGPMPLLTTKISVAYNTQVERMMSSGAPNLVETKPVPGDGSWVMPALFQGRVSDILSGKSPLREECFGPAAVVIPYTTDQEAAMLAAEGEGVLVGCVHAEENDPQASALVDGLASRAGRVVWNGWPTGVAVAPGQMHGGPYPAATVPGATSVGLHAAARFARPVVFQSVPSDLRP